MEKIIFIAIVVVILTTHLFNVFLELINSNYGKNKNVDELVADVYDDAKYLRQKQYEREKLRISLLESSFSTLIVICAFVFGAFGILNDWLQSNFSNQIIQSLLFFGIIWFIGQLFSVPFDFYDTFNIEEKYGFNKSSRKLFFLDILKSTLVTLIVGGVILAIISWLFINYTQFFWLPVMLVLVIFSLLSTVLYTTVILPMFNKKTPLPDGELKERLESLAEKSRFSAKSIFILDSSKRSTKANAFFTGWGSKKSIYLFDTLIEKLAPEEIEAVLAHEIGHYRKKHIWINFFIGLFVMGVFLFVFNRISLTNFFTSVMGSYSVSGTNFQLNLLGFVLLIEPIQIILGLFTNYLSRLMEYAADEYSKKLNLARPLITGLKKLSSLNFSNLTPHPLYVMFHYSHPPLTERIRNLDKSNK